MPRKRSATNVPVPTAKRADVSDGRCFLAVLLGVMIVGIAVLMHHVNLGDVGGTSRTLKEDEPTSADARRAAEFPTITSGEKLVVLNFLYTKNVMAEEEAVVRKVKFGSLLDPPPFSQYVKARERLNKLLEVSGDKHGDEIPSDVETFDASIANSAKWKAASAYIHPSVLKYPAQRVQRSGLCYIHAPEVLQHYLVSMQNKANAGMINIAEMIRDTWNGVQLTRHIFDNTGGNSHTMLTQILQPDSVLLTCTLKDYRLFLEQYGPALVSTFVVRDEFLDVHGGKSFGGTVSGLFKGHHAMVLIGVRIDQNTQQQWFLLQNWWPNMQFVEVSESYLESAGATVYFVKTPQSSIPTAFPTYTALYAENENLDKEETFAMLED